MLDEVKAKAGELSLFSDPRVGQPDRRHQVSVRERCQDLGVDPIRLAGKRRQALDLLGVCDLDVPALCLERVVDEAGPGHRLDHGRDGLSVGLLDSAGERSQGSSVRRRDELVDVIALIGDQADVELLAT